MFIRAQGLADVITYDPENPVPAAIPFITGSGETPFEGSGLPTDGGAPNNSSGELSAPSSFSGISAWIKAHPTPVYAAAAGLFVLALLGGGRRR